MAIFTLIFLLLAVILIKALLKMKLDTVTVYKILRSKGFSRDTAIALTALSAIETGWWKNYFTKTHFNIFSLHWSEWQSKYGGVPGEYERDDKSAPLTRFPSIEKGIEAAVALLKSKTYQIGPDDDWSTVYSKLYPKWAKNPPSYDTFIGVCRAVEKKLQEHGISD
jgi:hypothetical protein